MWGKEWERKRERAPVRACFDDCINKWNIYKYIVGLPVKTIIFVGEDDDKYTLIIYFRLMIATGCLDKLVPCFNLHFRWLVFELYIIT